MNALGTQLSRHALGQGPQPELGAGEGGIATAAAKTGGGPGEKYAALVTRRHVPGGLPPGQESRQAGHLPYFVENPLRGFPDREVHIAPGIGDDDFQGSDVCFDSRKALLNLGFLPGIESIAVGLAPSVFYLLNQVCGLVAVAATQADAVSPCRKPAGDSGTDVITGADDQANWVWACHMGSGIDRVVSNWAHCCAGLTRLL